MEIFVKSPYDRLVSPQAAFWHASGVDFNLDANGVKVDVQSLATLLNGGVSFETPSDRTVQEPAKAGETFRLAQTKAEAFKSPDAEGARLSMRFHQSVRGLVEGAPVDLRGIPVGRVVSIHLEEDASSREIDPVVSVEVYPKRIKDSGAGTLEGILARGARAQLRTGSLLTGQLYVALDFFQDAPFQAGPATEADGVRIVGTVPSDLEDLARHARSVMAKIDAIPLEGLGQDARRTLSSLDSVLRRMDSAVGRTDKTVLPELAGALKDLRSTMEGLKAVVDPDAPLQQDAREAIRGLSEAARSLKALGDELEQRPESLLRGRGGN